MDHSDNRKVKTIEEAIEVLRNATGGMTESETSRLNRIIISKMYSSKRLRDQVALLPMWMQYAADEAARRITAAAQSNEELIDENCPLSYALELMVMTVTLAALGRLKDERVYLELLFGCAAIARQHGADAGAASVMGKKRHAESYALIKDALNYWRENIDPTLSASKAANELVRVVPLSHKKLAQVVAAEKKKLT